MTYYDQISKSYNELYWEEQLSKIKVIKKNFELNPTDLLLDVGCGTGISSMLNCRVIGIDPSIELLKQADIVKIQAVAEHIPFKDKSFDYAISLTAVHNFQDIEKALKEIRRVTKNHVIITVLKKSEKLEKIESLIKQLFKIKKIIIEDKDIIFVA
jgi:ubiquinone/menaquinone biosynthesis C-methylase UbiE